MQCLTSEEEENMILSKTRPFNVTLTLKSFRTDFGECISKSREAVESKPNCSMVFSKIAHDRLIFLFLLKSVIPQTKVMQLV